MGKTKLPPILQDRDTVFVAKRRHLRMSARKVRLVADLVRGRPVSEAMPLLRASQKRAATHVLRLIESAMANAEYQVMTGSAPDLDREDLRIVHLLVDAGPKMKRFRPRSRGMVHPIEKKTCHITVALQP